MNCDLKYGQCHTLRCVWYVMWTWRDEYMRSLHGCSFRSLFGSLALCLWRCLNSDTPQVLQDYWHSSPMLDMGYEYERAEFLV